MSKLTTEIKLTTDFFSKLLDQIQESDANNIRDGVVEEFNTLSDIKLHPDTSLKTISEFLDKFFNELSKEALAGYEASLKSHLDELKFLQQLPTDDQLDEEVSKIIGDAEHPNET